MRDLQAAAGTPLAEVPAQPEAPAGRRRGVVLACVAAFVLAADAITKAIVVAHLREDQPVHLIGNVLELWLTRNSGAAFSVGTGQTIVFTLIAIGVIIAIVRTARRLYSTGWAIALGLLLGGAAGNLADRIFRAPGLFRGDVVDWIGVTPRYYPIFNLADSAIVCGGILIVVLAMRGYHLDGTRTVQAPESDSAPGDGTTDVPDAGTAGVRDSGTAGVRDSGTAGVRDSGTVGRPDGATAAAAEPAKGRDTELDPGR